jgi:hypothetical protein
MPSQFDVITEAADTALMFARLARDLPGWLRDPVDLQGARGRVRNALERREANFLSSAERLIYRHRRSPYLKVLDHAGCSVGDLRQLVRDEGVEGALRSLSGHGVYVTVDEMKGRRPITRGSLTFEPRGSDFDNPVSPLHLLSYTGGSGGRPSRVRRSLSLLSELTDLDLLMAAAHGHEGAIPAVCLANPIDRLIRHLRVGAEESYWLSPTRPLPWQVRVFGAYISMLARLSSKRLAKPEFIEIDRADLLCSWLIDHLGGSRRVLCVTTPSSAVRASVAATDTGRSLRGVTFMLRGEAVTPARRKEIESAGASLVTLYGAAEAVTMSISCPRGGHADEGHVMTHRFALTSAGRSVFDGGPEVSALRVTTLTDSAPKICFNTDLGDCGDISSGPSDCCELGALGLTTRLSNVRSFEKLTGEGMTVIGANFIRLLEHGLPAAFGGSSVDYQLVERQSEAALTELVLRVHPRIGPVDGQRVREALLGELERGDLVDRHVAHVWRRLETVRVVRESPVATPAGKVLPFRIERDSG